MRNDIDILDSFIAGEPLAVEELSRLKGLFSAPEGGREVESWLTGRWTAASEQDAEVSYEDLRRRISDYEASSALSHKRPVLSFVRNFQRVAAVLLIPLLVTAALFASGVFREVKTFTAEAPWGEKALLVLPDGSRVLLNAGSSVSYTSDFDRRNRRLKLSGEAYFEVAKNEGKPFIVSTPYLDVRVTGTKFNVNAYEDEPEVVASLVEGSVHVTTSGDKRSYRLTPGHSLALAKSSGNVTFPKLNNEVVLAWKDNRLIFADDDIASLAKKIERWYNLRVVYNPADFSNSKFTVRLMEGERLDKLIDIIETALDARCSLRGDSLVIARRK